MIQADKSIGCEFDYFYFETKLLHVENQNTFYSIGLTNTDYSTYSQPGWDRGSIGYHGDDGRLYKHTHGYGSCEYGQPYNKSNTTDVVGCFCNFRRKEEEKESFKNKGTIFFTLNGKPLAQKEFHIFSEPSKQYFPSICFGLRSKNAIVEINFGEKEFVFDVMAYLKEEKLL